MIPSAGEPPREVRARKRHLPMLPPPPKARPRLVVWKPADSPPWTPPAADPRDWRRKATLDGSGIAEETDDDEQLAAVEAVEAPPRDRSHRLRHVRATTINMDRFGKAKLQLLSALEPTPEGFERPRTRGDCAGGERPCPWVSCRYHLYLDVQSNGNLTINFPDLEPDQLEPSCALDVADRGGEVLERVGDAINVTRERIRQIEARIYVRLGRRMPREFLEGLGSTSDRGGYQP